MNTRHLQLASQRGFTLIELLVVIAIIAVLASIVLASLSSAQKGSRDSKRRSDLNQYKNALVQAYHDGNSLPAASDQTTASQPLGTALVTSKYLAQTIIPPTIGGATQTTYKYFAGSSGAFVLCVQLEKNTNWIYVTSQGLDDTKTAVCAVGNAA